LSWSDKWRESYLRYAHWEYWPMFWVYFPVFFLWLFYALKLRALLWNTAANPSIFSGGFVGEPKNEIYEMIPAYLIPKTLYLSNPGLNEMELNRLLKENEMGFPLIIKPNRGERGNKIYKIENREQLVFHLNHFPVDFLLQEYIDSYLEAAVFCVKNPQTLEVEIISLTTKNFLTVTGDGIHTLRELICNHDRAFMARKSLFKLWENQLNEVIEKGRELVLESIGNHCRGTEFISGMHLINDKMTSSFTDIMNQIQGVYVVRFDIRYTHPNDLENGKFKILELNGVGAEPAHIYDNSIGFVEKYQILFKLYHKIFQISKYLIQNKLSKPMSLKDWFNHSNFMKSYNKKLNAYVA
jgi:hypothetical protein